MTIRSMTGYGRAEGEQDGWTLTVECRSVNHRALDMRITAPAPLWPFEIEIRQAIKRYCGRGRIDCRLSLDYSGPSQLNPTVLRQVGQLFELLVAIQTHLNLERPPDLSDLLASGLSPASLTQDQIETDRLKGLVLAVVDEAVQALVATREREGRTLSKDLLSSLKRIDQLLDRIEQDAAPSFDAYRIRLEERLNELLDQLGSTERLDPDRLYQEIAFQLDKADINEELVRSRSHVDSIRTKLERDYRLGETMGKGIDFFLQELIRESNTMASKSSSAQVTGQIVEVKLEVERMREQVQNIE